MTTFHSETDLNNEVRSTLSRGPVRLFRNQVGEYQLIDGRYIKSGLCVGSSDLVGWREVEITPEMVGRKIAQFVALEGKTATGRVSEEQKRFIVTVNTAGGCAAVFRSVEEAKNIIEQVATG